MPMTEAERHELDELAKRTLMLGIVLSITGLAITHIVIAVLG